MVADIYRICQKFVQIEASEVCYKCRLPTSNTLKKEFQSIFFSPQYSTKLSWEVLTQSRRY